MKASTLKKILNNVDDDENVLLRGEDHDYFASGAKVVEFWIARGNGGFVYVTTETPHSSAEIVRHGKTVIIV